MHYTTFLLLLLSNTHAETATSTSAAIAIQPPAITREALLADPGFKACIDKASPAPKAPDCNRKPTPKSDTGRPDLFTKVEPDKLPASLAEGNLPELRKALEIQIRNCEKKGDLDKTQFSIGGEQFTRRQVCLDSNKKLLDIARTPNIDFAGFIAKAKEEMDFYQYKCPDQKGKITFTGYYSPIIEGSPTPTNKFKFPVYRTPPDLVVVTETEVECKGTPNERIVKKEVTRRRMPDGSIGPHYTREDINRHQVLKGKNLEIVYLDSPWEVHSLHIQGSGIVEQKNAQGKVEKTFYLNYGNRNGHKWLGTGSAIRCLRERTNNPITVTDLSMGGIGKWLNNNPDMADAVMNLDPSYVFFKDDGQKPKGVEGMLLTPGHSLAVDSSLVPMGAPVLLSTKRPLVSGGKAQGTREFQTLAVAQDVGGAIKGCKIDFYFGEGSDAGQAGGSMKNSGPAFVVLPKVARAN